jgi:hypothetical protein
MDRHNYLGTHWCSGGERRALLSSGFSIACSCPPRRFPAPWSVEELDDCFVVIDSAGQKLACVYFEEEPGRR